LFKVTNEKISIFVKDIAESGGAVM